MQGHTAVQQPGSEITIRDAVLGGDLSSRTLIATDSATIVRRQLGARDLLAAHPRAIQCRPPSPREPAALRSARALADRPHHDDDPAWLAFYGPAIFASHECRVALALHDFAAAEDSARASLALNNPVVYPRNHALYLTRLAEILVARREIEEGAAVAEQATIAAATIDSPRVTRGVQAVT